MGFRWLTILVGLDDRPGRINNNSLVLAVGETIYSVQISWVLPFWGFSGFPSKMVKTNQRRKQDKTRSTQKKMPEPEVQQLHNVGPTVARWRVPDVIFFLYLSIVFCLGFPVLPYALSFYWHFVLRPLHFILFFRGSTPSPGNRRGSYMYSV